MDVRTLFLAQTGALGATAAMLWAARAPADERSGLDTWTWAVTAQAAAYLLLANAGRLPLWLTAFGGNALGALSVALFFAAIRRFLGRPRRWWPLAAMVVAVCTVASAAGTKYETATIFNGYVYGAMQLLNGWALLRVPARASHRVQRLVAVFYLAMGLVLPLRATALALQGSGIDYLEHPLAWQEPIYAFGFLFVIVTNLGFLLMCKMRAEADVRLQAMTDELTGLANRRALDLAIAQALVEAQQGLRPFAVAMVDVDHFKRINDDFGHSTGDAVLSEFADRLRGSVSATDLPFRYGGEEFSVLLPGVDLTGALVVAEHLRQQVARPASAEGMHPVTASLGVAAWQPGDTADTLLRRADQGLYQAKSRGRNRVEAG